MRKRIFGLGLFLFVLIALFTLGSSTFTGAKSANDQPKKAPVNDALLKFLENAKREAPKFTSDDGHPLGYVPSPVDLSHVRGVIDEKVKAVSYPATYDLRTTGKLTAVRDQGGCGSCWCFGAYSSLESFLKPGETKDFSEQDLNATHGFDYAECEGGNSFMSQAYLARWSGPLDETDVPYPYATFDPQKHVQQVVWLPERASYTDNDTIKYFVTNYGAVDFSFYWYSSYFNDTYDSFYNPYSTSANHEIAIVGWDDNYDKSKFNNTPAGNGAFICRNSWGTSWGESGYLYMSYYDTSLQVVTSFNSAESADNYEAIYQYDPLGWVYSNNVCWPSSSYTGWGANIFTATASQNITAVGFITNDANTQYSIYVYKGVTAGQPRSGTLVTTKVGTNTYPGYYTVELDTPVSVSNGEEFSVVIKFLNTTYGYQVTTDGYYYGYASGSTSNPGESFYSCDGTTWTDMYDWGYNDNCNIKAFAGGGGCTPNDVDDLLGTWSSTGIWYKNSDTGGWVKLSSSAATQIAAGDIDGDCIDDLLGVWATGVWVRYSKTSAWAKLASVPLWLNAGDMNGDGKADVLGSWSTGVYYRDSETGGWTKLSSSASEVAAGDVDDDDIDDVFGIWSTGLYLKYSKTATWAKIASVPIWINAGDMNGDGSADVLGSWSTGVYYRDSKTGTWTKLGSSASQVAAGDLDGDSIDDLIEIYSSNVWIKYSETGWMKLSTNPDWIYAGRMRSSEAGTGQLVELSAPVGGFAEGPDTLSNFEDLSSFGPEGQSFVFSEGKNLNPQAAGMTIEIPGPGDIGFKFVLGKDLEPREKKK